jgi:hypothetical protein
MTLNKDVMAETALVNENARKVLKLGVPDIPTLLFVSSEIGQNWIEKQHDYAAKSDKIELIQLTCGHYMHRVDSVAEKIAGEIKKFLSKNC